MARLRACFANAFAVLVALPAAAQSSKADYFCGTCANGGPPPMTNTVMEISCGAGVVIQSIDFASYGTPTGSCGSYTFGNCNAANSTSIVTSTCVGQQSCLIYPNTTTFGDPCFGTAKQLVIQATCSSGTGAAVCEVVPTPAESNFTATVNVDWTQTAATLQIEPSVQVVSQHFLFRDSTIHDQSFRTLATLGAKYVRFVPWIPYAAYGVGELQPPSGAALCGPSNWAGSGQSLPVTIDCGDNGGTITSIDFASFGQPSGVCGNYSITPSCHAASSLSVVQAACIGKQSCSIATNASSNGFGPSSPCPGKPTWLAVQATCSNPDARFTYWNMTLADAFMTDFWNAVDGDSSSPIPNFSTQPSWLYDSTDYAWPENPDAPWYGYDRGTAPAANLTALGEYYGRLYSYFTNNQFTDEYGQVHYRNATAGEGKPLNISIIEVFNEVDYEHGHTPQSYTLEFDAVVKGVRSMADPQKQIQFVGLSLPNIDSTATIVEWAQYFLNASNHDPAAVDALNYIGYHAYPTNGPYTSDPTTFKLMFDYADTLVSKVIAVDAVIKQFSPSTLTALDETGTDMDNVLAPGIAPPDNNPRYWVAAAGYFAYLFATLPLSSPTVRVIGASQLMDAPGQEPSVTLLDWTTGNGTARFWVVKLLVDTTDPGDELQQTSTTVTTPGTDADALHAQAYASGSSSTNNRVLLVNKRNAWATVDLTAACPAAAPSSSACACSALVIDEFNGLQPARQVACGTGSGGSTQLVLAPYATALVTF